MVSLQSIITWMECKYALIISLLVGLVLVGGGIYSTHLGSTLRFLPDEAEYITLARNLADLRIYSLDGMHPTAFRPPGYALVLSLLSLFGGDVIHFRFLNFILLAGCIILVSRIMLQKGSRLAAIFGGLLIAAYPVLFYTSGTLYPQTLAGFLFLLLLTIFIQPELRSLDFIAGGGILGLLILTVPTFFFVIFIIWGWLLLYRKFGSAKKYMLTIGIAFLVISLWTARNYSVFGEIFFVSTNGGENLLVGNSENTTPNAGTTVDISKYLQKAAGLDEVERDRYLNRQAINYILSHPLDSFKLYLQKVVNYFNYRNHLVTASEGSRAKDFLMLLTYAPLVGVFFLRLLSFKQSRPTPAEVLFILLYLSSAFVTAIYFPRIRFRLPFDYLLIMLVAMTLDRMVRFTQNRKFAFSRLDFFRS